MARTGVKRSLDNFTSSMPSGSPAMVIPPTRGTIEQITQINDYTINNINSVQTPSYACIYYALQGRIPVSCSRAINSCCDSVTVA